MNQTQNIKAFPQNRNNISISNMQNKSYLNKKAQFYNLLMQNDMDLNFVKFKNQKKIQNEL
jgi:hypothetical protein